MTGMRRSCILRTVSDDVTTPARVREDADVGIYEIVDMMTGGEWVTGRSTLELAKKHGVSVGTVKNWATAASRVIRLAIGTDPDELRSRYMAALEGIAASAMNKRSATKDGEIYDSPDHKAAISAIAESAKLAGIVTQKHELTTMTEERAAKRWEELTGKPWEPKQ